MIDSESTDSAIIVSLQMFREALANNDESKMAEIETFLKSVEDEKSDLEKKVTTLTEELSIERDRVLRISADFENFRKRIEREKLSLVSNAQGEVVENLLPVLDNFERAKAQIKIETEGEEKINNSYQNIYKQFVEILSSLGVVAVETVGKPFDPMVCFSFTSYSELDILMILFGTAIFLFSFFPVIPTFLVFFSTYWSCYTYIETVGRMEFSDSLGF